MRINTIACSGLLAVALLTAGCDKEKCPPATQAANAPDPSADIRNAAENSVRLSAGQPDSVRFRGIQVWPQAGGNRFVVCGQVNVFGPNSNTFVLFVATVTRDAGGQDPARRFQVESRVGSTVSEATKVYVETLARCHESASAQPMRREAVAPVPPMPDDVKAVLLPPASTAPQAPPPTIQVPSGSAKPPAPASSPQSGTVVMRQNANIRIAPQGEVIRVEPQGKELRVFGEAPGGWLQIGDSAANGWVHTSLVERR